MIKMSNNTGKEPAEKKNAKEENNAKNDALYCGDFNLEHFIISRPKPDDSLNEWLDIIRKKKEYYDSFDSKGRFFGENKLREEFLGMKYAEINPDFLGLSINVEYKGLQFKLPKFSTFRVYFSLLDNAKKISKIDQDFLVKFNYTLINSFFYEKKNKGYHVKFEFQGEKNLVAYLNKSITHSPEGLEFKDNTAVIAFKDANKYSWYNHIRDGNKFLFLSRFMEVPSLEMDNAILDSAIIDTPVYIVSMNTPKHYLGKDGLNINFEKFSDYEYTPRNNILLLKNSNNSFYAIGSFNPLDLKSSYKAKGFAASTVQANDAIQDIDPANIQNPESANHEPSAGIKGDSNG